MLSKMYLKKFQYNDSKNYLDTKLHIFMNLY